MDNIVVVYVLRFALVVLVALLIPTVYRVVRGPRIADRMLGIDMITTILTGSMVLLAIIEDQSLLIDVALAVSALSFIGSLAIARYVSEGRVF